MRPIRDAPTSESGFLVAGGGSGEQGGRAHAVQVTERAWDFQGLDATAFKLL